MKGTTVLTLWFFAVLFAGDAMAQWDDPHPEAAWIRYPQGAAPFYVRVRSYARQLGRYFEQNADLAIRNEASAMGVDVMELAAINNVLAQHRQREDQAGTDGWRQECIPLLRGDDVTDEQAKQAFIRRDTTDWRETVAAQILDEVEVQLGSELAAKLRQRIVVRGEAIQFSRTETAKAIELGRGGLFLSHMMIECGTHPDYAPKF